MESIAMNALSAGEERRLSQLEQQIESSGRQMIAALKTIHDAKLYRAHGNFEDYCLKRWKMTGRRARQLIAHGTVIGHLESDPKSGTIVPLLTEAATREIADLPPETQVLVVEKSCKNGQKPTAKAIREARRTIAPKQNRQIGDQPKELTPCPHCMGTGYID